MLLIFYAICTLARAGMLFHNLGFLNTHKPADIVDHWLKSFGMQMHSASFINPEDPRIAMKPGSKFAVGIELNRKYTKIDLMSLADAQFCNPGGFWETPKGRNKDSAVCEHVETWDKRGEITLEGPSSKIARVKRTIQQMDEGRFHRSLVDKEIYKHINFRELAKNHDMDSVREDHNSIERWVKQCDAVVERFKEEETEESLANILEWGVESGRYNEIIYTVKAQDLAKSIKSISVFLMDAKSKSQAENKAQEIQAAIKSKLKKDVTINVHYA